MVKKPHVRLQILNIFCVYIVVKPRFCFDVGYNVWKVHLDQYSVTYVYNNLQTRREVYLCVCLYIYTRGSVIV